MFQGIEIYRDKPILYSTGDFIDDYAVDPLERNDRSFIFIVETDNHKVQGLKLYPTVIRDFQARLAKGKEAQEITEKMQKLCTEFDTKSSLHAEDRFLEIKVL